MSKTKESPPTHLRYRQVRVAALNKGRRGKHHDLVVGILQELEALSSGSAMEIPLAEVGGIGVTNLRSAVHRAATSHGLEIGTRADEKNFYVWRKKKRQIEYSPFSNSQGDDQEVHRD